MLQVESVNKSFGGLQALSNVNLTVRRGTITSLIGPNGSGKTTLFNAITRILPIDSGRIIFDNERIDHLPPHSISGKGIARTFQIISLFPEATVFENIASGAYSRTSSGALSIILRSKKARLEEAEIRERTMNAIKLNDLERWANIPAGLLPFGQQRLVEFARVLASEPRLVLLDEPLSGLTEKESSVLQGRILDMKARGVTILFVEHEMKAVMRISDEIHVLNFGEKIAEGNPEEIRQNPVVVEAYLGTGT